MRFSVESDQRPGDERPQLGSCCCSLADQSKQSRCVLVLQLYIYTAWAATNILSFYCSLFHGMYIDRSAAPSLWDFVIFLVSIYPWNLCYYYYGGPR
ncbi:hypothetical protein BDW74DRAFT_151607 [Aspergillus multicolor]|uniref:uncharacterized protein n=1 Tax=Aspergillus multicolor TaxID=41759 RepID=UPI003CCDA28A